jgi:hypothetical protein
MNQLQLNYLNLKKQMEELENAEKWEQLEEVEDQFLDAETELVHWSLEQLAKYDKQSAEFLKKNWTRNVDKIVELALNLKVA